MKRLFGTDGMRGVAGKFPLDAATIRIVGKALARRLASSAKSGQAPLIITGRDTRESGPWIEAALTEGAVEGGVRCESAGVITTPGVAYLTRTVPAIAGVVISASHNPYHDNGIKIFAPSGQKLDEETERLIEKEITDNSAEKADVDSFSDTLPLPNIRHINDSQSEAFQDRYLEYLASEVAAGQSFSDLRMVIDCANGAASRLAPRLFQRLGANVMATNDQPNGRNINQDCGSLNIKGLQRRVTDEGADLGVAYDGDADRALFVDARGRFVDGDQTLWVMAQFLKKRGELAADTVVATVMSNIGLELALRSIDVALVRTEVGDKYVLEELLESGTSIGGEQSGHIIFPRVSLAGDGMLTTILVLRAIEDAGAKLEDLTAGFQSYPQILLNVRVREKPAFGDIVAIANAARDVEAALAGKGRLLLRYSGTEPLARVMIEGERQETIERLAEDLASTIRSAIGAP